MKSAEGVVGLALIYFMLILIISPLELKMYYLKNIVVFFYGAPSWHLEVTMVQSVCADWRKALRGVWSGNKERIVILLLSI